MRSALQTGIHTRRHDMTKELTKPETSRLSTLERTIRTGKNAFIAVGKALTEIRDSRLYREKYSTFETYCSDVWGWKKSRAYQIIGAAGLVKSLPEKSPPLVDNLSERAVRPLLKVPREKLHQVIDAAADSGATTAKEIQAVVDEVTAPELKDCLGTSVPEDLREDWIDATRIGEGIRKAGRAWKSLVDAYLNEGEKFRQKHALTEQMSKDIGDMISEMSRTIPYAVCPWCKGEGKRCEKCHSRGWVSKIYWNQFVPAKFKKKAQEHNGAEIVSD